MVGRSSEKPSRVAALDGVRAVAVLAVVAAHTLPVDPSHGAAGVRLFLVLSGFLITRTLLEAIASGAARSTIAGHFYVRRALRLTPLYYLTLLAAAILGFSAVERNGWWYWLYASNIHAALTGTYDRSLGHFWSLALEEQFYLLWPWVILFVPKQWLLRSTFAMIAFAVAFRWWLIVQGQPVAAYVLMPARMDALGVGAACAIAEVSARTGRRLFAAGLMAWLGVVALGWSGIGQEAGWYVTAAELTSVCRDAGLIVMASHGIRSLPGDVLTLPWMVGLGRVSYAVYVFHFMIPELSEIAGRVYGLSLSLPPHGGLRFAIVFSASLLLAAASWRFLEGPIGEYYRARWRFGPVADDESRTRHGQEPKGIRTPVQTHS